MDIYETKVVPFVIRQEKEKNGEKEIEIIDNITLEESRNMSKNPVMLWREPGTDYYYLAEQQLYSRRGTSIKMFLCYLYEELSESEKELFKDRTIEIPLTRKGVTQVYSKKKVKERK